MFVKDRSQRSHHQTNSSQNTAHETGPRGRTEYVYEETITHGIGFVAGLMLKGVIENEQFVLFPIVRLIAYANENVLVVDVVDVV